MSGYGVFSRYYDLLTENIDYPARAGYFDKLLKRYGSGAGLVLDLACGTGRLTRELARLGYDMIGVDASGDMLAQAMGASPIGEEAEAESPILYLRQRAEKLDLYGTVDACVCALDSLNHLPGKIALREAMGRVALFLNPGGLFVFDMNTPYKHREILADSAFIYDCGDVFCAWSNNYRPADGRVEIALDFFVRVGNGLYRREEERFTEYCYEDEVILEMLRDCGLTPIAVLEGDTFKKPSPETERVIYVARKEKAQRKE